MKEEGSSLTGGAGLSFGLVACGLQPPITHPKSIPFPPSHCSPALHASLIKNQINLVFS